MTNMKSLDSTEKKENSQDSSDKELVSMMGFALLDKGGLDTIKAALDTSEDPAQVVGQFLAQMMGQLAEMTRDQLGIDPGIFTEPDGFLDQQIDYIERKLGLPANFSDQIYGDTLEVVKAAAMDPNSMPQEGQPQQQAPAPGGQPSLDAMGGM